MYILALIFISNMYNYTDLMPKKVLARIVVTIRAARSIDEKKKEEFPPLIVSGPRTIAKASNIKPSDQMMMYTDGERIYLDKIKEPEI